MDKNFKINIEYDGTSFFGWQRQKDKPSIQGEIEKTLSRILNQGIKINGSGRTDAGVHAYGQVANFHADTNMLPMALKKSMNSMMKGPIVIRDCHLVAADFHARYSATSKEYHYFVFNSPIPCAINRQYQWHLREHLDIEKMNQCCLAIIGEHNFKSFENTGSPRSSAVRKVFSADIIKTNHHCMVFKIHANGFLRYMVRNIVGTLVLVGKGSLSLTEFLDIFRAKDRTLAASTAPPHGLFLKRVNYS